MVQTRIYHWLWKSGMWSPSAVLLPEGEVSKNSRERKRILCWYRTRPWGLPGGLQRSTPLYIPIISLNKLRCSKTVPAFSTAGTKQRTQAFALCSQLNPELLAGVSPYLQLEPVDICLGAAWESRPSGVPADSLELRFGSTISYAIESSPVRRLLKTHFPIWTLSWAQRVVGLCFPGSCFLPWGF